MNGIVIDISFGGFFIIFVVIYLSIWNFDEVCFWKFFYKFNSVFMYIGNFGVGVIEYVVEKKFFIGGDDFKSG